MYGTTGILVLTVINIIGIREGKGVQNLLTAVKVLGLLCIVTGGIFFSWSQPVSVAQPHTTNQALGLAMIFVLLTYGGWNEAAYISAEVKGEGRGIVRSLLWGIFTHYNHICSR